MKNLLTFLLLFSMAGSTAFAAPMIIYSNETNEQRANTLILDSNDSGGDIVLQFGTTLAKKLFWDATNSIFVFNDDVNIGGDLFVDGNSLILDYDDSGGDISLIFGNTIGAYLKHDGSIFSFSDSLRMIDDNKIEFRDSDLSINSSVDGQLDIDADTKVQITAPTIEIVGDLDVTGDITGDLSGVTIDGDTNTIQNINWTSIKPRPKKLKVDITDITILEDGSNNFADLYIDSETGTNPHEYYLLKTRRNTLQDLDIKIKVRLPHDFIDFTSATNDIGFWYKNTGADNTESKIDISVQDKDGDHAFTPADGQGLFNTAWTSFTKEFDGANFDPVADDYIYITIKGYASYIGGNFNSPYIGEVVFTYTGK